MKKLPIFMHFFAAILWIPSVFAAPALTPPVSTLSVAAESIISTLKANQATIKKDPAIIERSVRKILLPQVDVAGMSRSVLGRNAWMKATLVQKQAFAKAFTNLVIRTYSRPLADYKDESVTFYPAKVTPGAKFLNVRSVINRSEGKTIPVTYSLVNKQGSWKVYDMSVEGVSLLQSFRQQFSGALQQSSLDDLINQMKKPKAALSS